MHHISATDFVPFHSYFDCFLQLYWCGMQSTLHGICIVGIWALILVELFVTCSIVMSTLDLFFFFRLSFGNWFRAIKNIKPYLLALEFAKMIKLFEGQLECVPYLPYPSPSVTAGMCWLAEVFLFGLLPTYFGWDQILLLANWALSKHNLFCLLLL